ncbi:MAG: ATP-binding protein [Patescibacteria group bacterium]|nr:ATP-binding protein [Patescibacteria group bacterium]
MKKRLLYYSLIPHINHKNALVITGMRQVGKTTLMRQIFKEIGEKPKVWFDLDNPLDQKVFEDIDYRNIFTRLAKTAEIGENKRLFVFIDEIQNFPEITKVMKYLIDHFGVKFIVTGSSNFYLKNLFPESLSGRKFLYDLSPLSFRECLYFKEKITLQKAQENDLEKLLRGNDLFKFKKFELDYDDYLRFGGFPEVVMTEDTDTKKEILKNIFASFFEKDLKILSDHQDIRQLRDFILLLVPRVGSLLEISKLASELGIDRPKVYGFLEFLQGTFFIKLLPKFSRSIDRTVAGGRKVYFSDTGILNSIGQVNEAQLFENAAVNQLSVYGSVSFYRKKNAAEIDAILDGKTAFEIKLRGTENDLRKVSKVAESIKIKRAFIISKVFTDKKKIVAGLNL